MPWFSIPKDLTRLGNRRQASGGIIAVGDGRPIRCGHRGDLAGSIVAIADNSRGARLGEHSVVVVVGPRYGAGLRIVNLTDSGITVVGVLNHGIGVGYAHRSIKRVIGEVRVATHSIYRLDDVSY